LVASFLSCHLFGASLTVGSWPKVMVGLRYRKAAVGVMGQNLNDYKGTSHFPQAV
jgi:hypothetical protein